SILLIVLILLQVKGGALGNLLGSDGGGGGFTHTRRGLEKTLFQITVYLCIVFMAISLFSVVLSG
ncbi:MAG: preprotein translocase subunit SecG, partial [Chloroflexota bacterium]